MKWRKTGTDNWILYFDDGRRCHAFNKSGLWSNTAVIPVEGNLIIELALDRGYEVASAIEAKKLCLHQMQILQGIYMGDPPPKPVHKPSNYYEFGTAFRALGFTEEQLDSFDVDDEINIPPFLGPIRRL
jgi:hypothetical protein